MFELAPLQPKHAVSLRLLAPAATLGATKPSSMQYPAQRLA
jgi:hypothetical protein